MTGRTVLRALFIFYCAEAGALLIMAPWSALWDRTAFYLAPHFLQTLYLHRFFRGAVTGLGLIHLVWGVHDLEDWLAKRGRS